MGAKWHDTVVGFSRSCLVVGVTTVVVVVVGLFDGSNRRVRPRQTPVSVFSLPFFSAEDDSRPSTPHCAYPI